MDRDLRKALIAAGRAFVASLEADDDDTPTVKNLKVSSQERSAEVLRQVAAINDGELRPATADEVLDIMDKIGVDRRSVGSFVGRDLFQIVGADKSKVVTARGRALIGLS